MEETDIVDNVEDQAVTVPSSTTIHKRTATCQRQRLGAADSTFIVAQHSLTNESHPTSYMEISTDELDGSRQGRLRSSRRASPFSVSKYGPSGCWRGLFLSPGPTFWMLGLLNNSSFVIMIACAKQISEGGTALVYLASVIPSLSIKMSSPFWFDKVPYTTRMAVAAIFMMGSFTLIAILLQYKQNDAGSSDLSSTTILCGQLLGVALTAAQSGLGEASLLALAGKYDSEIAESQAPFGDEGHSLPITSSTTETINDGGRIDSTNNTNNHQSIGTCLTCYSSGTGLAGIFGFFWKWFFNDFLGWSLPLTLFLALSLAILYWVSFRCLKVDSQLPMVVPMTPEDATDASDSVNDNQEVFVNETQALKLAVSSPPSNKITSNWDTNPDTDISPVEYSGCNAQATNYMRDDTVTEISDMTSWERVKLSSSLWPYMIPLFVVYAAEYALQSGTWTAIGFPTVYDQLARDRFYEFGNWSYQAGVFVSRSSGTLFTAPMWLLWVMPFLQVCNVVLFWFVAASSPHLVDDVSGLGDVAMLSASSQNSQVLDFFYQPGVLYPICFYVGLLGGGVFVSGYLRICADLPLAHREFAISTTTCADGLGIVLADVIGLYLQSCLYQIHGLEGAVVTCPLK